MTGPVMNPRVPNSFSHCVLACRDNPREDVEPFHRSVRHHLYERRVRQITQAFSEVVQATFLEGTEGRLLEGGRYRFRGTVAKNSQIDHARIDEDARIDLVVKPPVRRL